MHEKARLGILTSLITRPEGVLFTELKKLCSLSDGNLSRHLQALEEAGQSLYAAAAAAQQGGDAGAAGGAPGAGAQDDVVDAEFTEVKDDDRK